jgi:hypothetical protein
MVAARVFGVLAMLCAAVPGRAQPGSDELTRLGGVATVAPLCGVRDEGWAFDLRRAAVQSATGSKRFDDPALRDAPGRKEAEVALGAAEMEALEDFAEAPPEKTCGPLVKSPELVHADEVVRAFRAQFGPRAGS